MTIKIENVVTANDALPTILYNNFFATGTLAASSEAVGYPKESVRSENTIKFWRPTSLPANISVDLGTARAMDSFAIVAHDCGTRGNTILLQSSPDNSAWTTRCTVIPTDNTTILGLFTSVSARYWRVQISGGTVPTIGVIILTNRFILPGGVKPPYVPIWLSHQFELLTANTLGGQFMGNRILRKAGRTQISLVAFERTYVESTLIPFRDHYNSGKPFIFASGPSVFTKDVGYVWRTESSSLNPIFDENGSWMSTSMEVYCYGE